MGETKIELDCARARIRVLETVARFYGLLGHWQGNKEGHEESVCERDIGDLARKVMGGAILLPEDEAAKRDAVIERMRTEAVSRAGLHVRELVENDEVLKGLRKKLASETERCNCIVDNHIACLQRLAEALDMSQAKEGSVWNEHGVIQAIATKVAEIERLEKKILEICDLHNGEMVGAAEEANRLAKYNRIGLSQLLQKFAEALGLPKTIEGAEYGMYAIDKGIKALRDKLALASAEEGDGEHRETDKVSWSERGVAETVEHDG